MAPSILAADFSQLGDEIHRVQAAGADWIHCDIMDGHFVDNISFGPEVVRRVRGLTSLPLDVHLMIERAEHYVPRFIEAGANSITVHVESEAKHNVAKTLQQIRQAGCRTGLTLNPETSFNLVEPFLDNIDMLLVMTVHPGFGGQSFRADQMQKVKRARSLNSTIDIEVDGDTARAWSRWLWVVPYPDGKPRVERAGHYEDTLVRENGKWKFRSRQAFTEINP